MIHDHEALELASAALDFELSASESRMLAEAVADCPVCAERAAAYREQRRLLAEMPVLDVSSATRHRIVRAAVAGRADSRPPLLLIAAALLLGLVLAAIAVAGALFNRSGPTELSLADRSSALSTAPQASPGASAGATPLASAPVGAGGQPILAGDSIVEVVSGDLRVRSQPRVASDSIKYEPLLQVGDRLFVVQGPVVANDYEWYEIAPIGTGAARPWFSLPSGWIARGDHDGTPWVSAITPDCPQEPVDISALGAMHAFERVACFGNRPLSFRAFVEGGVPPSACDPAVSSGPCVAGPEWLAGVGGWSAESGARHDTGTITSGPELALDPGGEVGATSLPDRQVVEIEGSFDHARSIDCQTGGVPPGHAALTPARAVLHCRSRFVVTRAVPAANLLVPGTAAVTVTDNLRVRSLPAVASESIRLSPLLDRGTRLFVLEGPQIGSGYDWYEVVVPSIEDTDTGLMVGWVAVGGRTGERWVATEESACPPASAITVTDLVGLTASPHRDGGLICFGRHGEEGPASLRFEAAVDLACDESAPETLPGWLADRSASLVLGDGLSQFRAKADPDLGIPLDCAGRGGTRFLVEGRFDHEDAQACEANPALGSAAAIDERVAAYRCRTRFVVTSLSLVGA